MQDIKTYEDDLLDRLGDPAYAVEYLRAALEDDEDELSDQVFLIALGNVAKAAKMSTVAQATGLNRVSLYKILSANGNPSLSSLKAILKALGLKMTVVPSVASEPVHYTLGSSQLFGEFHSILTPYEPVKTVVLGMVNMAETKPSGKNIDALSCASATGEEFAYAA
jgi:probable addiction module antidote protein